MPDEVFEVLRSVASREQISLQALALRLITDDVVRLRRKEALVSTKQRLTVNGAQPLPENAATEAVLQARRDRGLELGTADRQQYSECAKK